MDCNRLEVLMMIDIDDDHIYERIESLFDCCICALWPIGSGDINCYSPANITHDSR